MVLSNKTKCEIFDRKKRATLFSLWRENGGSALNPSKNT